MSLRRARRPARALLGRDAYLDEWSGLHGKIDPTSSALVRRWLGFVFVLGYPLARRSVSPHTVTLAGVGFAILAIGASVPGTRWPLLAAVLVLGSAVLDGIDGAVAVIGRSSSRWGYVLDTVADRCSDLCFLGAAYVLGAPPLLLVATGAMTLLQESARARATGVGLSDVGILTVWERPSRVVTVLVITVGAGSFPANTTFIAFMGALVGALLSTVGFAQLMIVLARRLR